jgi:Arginase/agmatinase/formimionoglutamate hydrolase, arginase family
MGIKQPQKCDILIQKLPSDIGIHRISRKGTLNAPDKVLDGFEFDEDVLVDEVFPDEFSLEKTHNRIFENTKDLIDYDKPVISVGGDHSVSFPVIKALKEEYPDLELVWLDSHLDLKEKVDDHVSHDVVVRELLKNGFSENEITFVGITRIDEDEEQFLMEYDLNVYRSEDVPQFLEDYNYNNRVYLSVDIDVLKESEAPGTGYPDGHLSLQQVQKVVKKVDPRYADLVEVAPPFDKDGRTVENARKVLSNLT